MHEAILFTDLLLPQPLIAISKIVISPESLTKTGLNAAHSCEEGQNNDCQHQIAQKATDPIMEANTIFTIKPLFALLQRMGYQTEWRVLRDH